MKPRVCILRTDGTNCDHETSTAFRLAGGEPYFVHVNELRTGSRTLADFHILALPGGFSYGDDVASGKILAVELMTFLGDQLRAFVEARKLVIGICNGFQVLVRTGLLPFGKLGTMSATLAHNASGHFQCEWVELKAETPCVFTHDLDQPDLMLQIAHGEGRFYAPPEVLARMEAEQLIVLRYRVRNPNGSQSAIAGVCDPTRRIFGLMPHPERLVVREQHPNWRRLEPDLRLPHGLKIFVNAVRYARDHL